MVYLAKKNGGVIAHTDLEAMEALDGISAPDMTVTDAEWEAAGDLARIIDGEIFLDRTPKKRRRKKRKSRQSGTGYCLRR